MEITPPAQARLFVYIRRTVIRKTVVVRDSSPYLLRFSWWASLEIPLIVS
jgi:hypothetical protein